MPILLRYAVRPGRRTRGALSLLLLLSWCAGPVFAAPGAQAPAALSAQAALERLDGLFAALEGAEKEIPRDSFDPSAVVAEVGKEPAKLFAWVRERTTWVPYQGALRGPRGVLMDRLGNSLDRSLLLAELLGAAGHKVRLAKATLPVDVAKAALARGAEERSVPASAATADANDAQAAEAALTRFVEKAGLDPAEVRANFAARAAEAQRVKAEARQRAGEQAAKLREWILKAGPTLGSPRSQARDEAEALAAMRDHWWVQRLEGQNWIDSDLLHPDGKPGAALVAARETIDLPAGSFAEKVPLKDGDCHLVEISVIVEQWNGQKLIERTVLRHTLRPTETLGRRLLLAHVSADGPGPESLLGADDVVTKVREAARQSSEWAPVLQVGDDVVTQGGFTAAGDVVPKARLGGEARVAKAVSGSIERKAGLLDALDEPPAAPAREGESGKHLTAEWIDYAIRAPGRPQAKVRRQVFDLLGPAARASLVQSQSTPQSAPKAPEEAARLRRGLALLGTTEILLQPCRMSDEYVASLAAAATRANAKTLRTLVAASSNQAPARPAASAQQVVADLVPLPGALYELAAARHAWRAENTAGMYLDRPNVLALHRHFDVGHEGQLTAHESFDIAFNDVAQLGPSNNTADNRFAQGVLDTIAEAALLAPRKSEHHHAGPASGAAAVLAARGDAADWVVLHGRVEDWVAVGLSPDARARAEADLKKGYVVVAPRATATAATGGEDVWWRVHPDTGECLGIGARGWGSQTVEFINSLRAMLKAGVGLACLLKALTGTQGITGPNLNKMAVLCVIVGATGVGGLTASGKTASAVYGLIGDIAAVILLFEANEKY